MSNSAPLIPNVAKTNVPLLCTIAFCTFVATCSLSNVSILNVVKPAVSAATPVAVHRPAVHNTLPPIDYFGVEGPQHGASQVSNQSESATSSSLLVAAPMAVLAAVVSLFRAAKPEAQSVHVKLDSVVSSSSYSRQSQSKQLLILLQEEAQRAKIEAEQRGFFNLFHKLNPAKAAAKMAAAAPLIVPTAAFASGGATPTSVTPDLVAGVGAGVGLVAFGQVLYNKAGGHGHGPPEAAHPIDPVAQPYPEGEDGEALKAVFAEPYDIWRQSLLRYLGYSNELGEAFRPLVGDFLANSTYIVAVSYVLADAVDKASRASERGRELAASAVFMQMDEGLRGELKNADLQAALADVKAPLATAEIQEFLSRADIRKDNNIDFDEFYLALKRRDPALIAFLEAGAKNLPADVARPWQRALQDGVNLTEVKSAVAGLDALLWQLTASVAMPGFTINRIVALCGAICYGLKQQLVGTVDPAVIELLTYLPTAVGLLAITVIVHPLDTLADELFNVSIRKYVFGKLPMDTTGQLTEEDVIKKLDTRARADGKQLPDDWVRKLFKEVDADKDGFVSLTEWRRNGLGAYERYLESLKTPW